VAALAATAACSQEGAVHIRVLAPTAAALSPLDARLARLTLTAEMDGRPPQVATREVTAPLDGSELDFGALAVADGVRLSLLASSAAGLMLGYGRAAPVSIVGDEVQDVPIYLRRAFVYLTGGTSLSVIDTTLSSGGGEIASVAVTNPVAAAPTADGAEVVTIAGGALSLLATADHRSEAVAPVALAAGASEVSVSPDSRWAVVVHGGAAGGVSLVDLQALRAGAGAAAVGFAALANPGRVAVAGDTAWILADAATDAGCTSPSRLVPVPLALPPQPGGVVALASGGRDLVPVTAGSRAGALLIAEPCANQVALFAAGAAPSKLMDMPGATTVAVSGGRAFSVGQAGSSGEGTLHLVVMSQPLDGGGTARLDLPPAQELAVLPDASGVGIITEQRISANALDAAELSVLPDGQHLALLVRARYHAAALQDVLSGTIVFPAIDIDVREYALYDGNAGTAAQRVRTLCDLRVTDDPSNPALFPDWVCGDSPGQDGIAPAFKPLHARVLYGAR
jgi:hypothetical protein